MKSLFTLALCTLSLNSYAATLKVGCIDPENGSEAQVVQAIEGNRGSTLDFYLEANVATDWGKIRFNTWKAYFNQIAVGSEKFGAIQAIEGGYQLYKIGPRAYESAKITSLNCGHLASSSASVAYNSYTGGFAGNHAIQLQCKCALTQ